MTLDLISDLGEGFGSWTLGNEVQISSFVKA